MRTVACVVLLLAALMSLDCRGPLAPCHDSTGPVVSVDGFVNAAQSVTSSVTSPRGSNLLFQLSWTDTDATLGLSATVTNCGEHAGCLMNTYTPSTFRSGGTSGPTPQPWPPGLREMLLDGSRGKTYRIDIAGDPVRATTFSLRVSYRITCEN